MGVQSRTQLLARDASLGLGTLSGYYAILFLLYLVQRNAASTAQLAVAWTGAPSLASTSSSSATDTLLASKGIASDRTFMSLCALNVCAWVASMLLRSLNDLNSYQSVFLLALSLTTIVVVALSCLSLWRTRKHLRLGAGVGGEAVLAALSPFHNFIAVASVLLLALAALQMLAAVEFLRAWSTFPYYARRFEWSDLVFGCLIACCCLASMTYAQLTRPRETARTTTAGGGGAVHAQPFSPSGILYDQSRPRSSSRSYTGSPRSVNGAARSSAPPTPVAVAAASDRARGARDATSRAEPDRDPFEDAAAYEQLRDGDVV